MSMRNLNHLRIWPLLIMLSLNSSCSHGKSLRPPPRLADRTLSLDPEKPSLYYRYEKVVCLRPDRFIFKKCHNEWVLEEFDLTDKETRLKLINMGFIMQTKNRFKY